MILEVKNGTFGYSSDSNILENVNLTLDEGHILAILGPNGIGKTTLLKCMMVYYLGKVEIHFFMVKIYIH